MEWFEHLVANWDILGLILSNIIALFLHPPFRAKK